MRRGADKATVRRDRELFSADRAGSWSRGRAREVRRRFIRAHWRILAAVFGVAVALAPASLLLPSATGWFALGLWTASVGAGLSHLVVVYSGSAYLDVAAQAEVWTREELRGLRKQGWRVINRVTLKANSDIDHVAIGPGGLIVLETKWSIARPGSSREDPWLRDSARQAAENAQIARNVLKGALGQVPTRIAVVVWPASTSFEARSIEGVTILPGDRLRDWLGEQRDAALSRDQIDAAWRIYETQLDKRDRFELDANGPPPPSLEHIVWRVGLLLVGVLLGLVATAMAAKSGLIVCCAAIAATSALALAARRWSAISGLAVGVLVGNGVSAGFLLAAYAALAID